MQRSGFMDVKTVQEHIHIFMMRLLKLIMLQILRSLPGTAAVVNAVKKDVNGIGYGGAAYAVGVKHAKVKKDANSTAYLPSKESIAKG